MTTPDMGNREGWSPVQFVGGRLVLELTQALKDDPLDRNQQSEAIAFFVRAWLDGVLSESEDDAA